MFPRPPLKKMREFTRSKFDCKPVRPCGFHERETSHILILIRCLPIFIVGLQACGNGGETGERPGSKKEETVRIVVNDTIPAERTEISKTPVAVYLTKIPDPLNDFEFSVKLLETPLRFRYYADIRYKMLDVRDTVDLPNFGFQPRIDVRKHTGDLSCMIGFYDENGVFKDLKKVEVTNNQLKILQVKRYGLGTVRKKQ